MLSHKTKIASKSRVSRLASLALIAGCAFSGCLASSHCPLQLARIYDFFFSWGWKSFFPNAKRRAVCECGHICWSSRLSLLPGDHGDVMEKSRNVTDRDGRGGILHRPPSLLCLSLLLRLFVQSRQRQRQKTRKAFCAGEAWWKRRGRKTGLP